MGLRAVGQKAILAAFKAAGDAATEVQYRTKTQATYDPATDSQGETVVDTDVQILYDFKSKENKSGDTNTDYQFTGIIKGIISAEDLPANTPKTEDLIVDGTVVYKIKGFEPIGPFSEAIGYTLHLVKDSG